MEAAASLTHQASTPAASLCVFQYCSWFAGKSGLNTVGGSACMGGQDSGHLWRQLDGSLAWGDPLRTPSASLAGHDHSGEQGRFLMSLCPHTANGVHSLEARQDKHREVVQQRLGCRSLISKPIIYLRQAYPQNSCMCLISFGSPCAGWSRHGPCKGCGS